MIRFFSVFLLISFNSSITFSQDTARHKTFYLGADSISIATTCFLQCDSNIIFIQLHEDESTGIEAAQDYFTEHSGYLVQLKHTGKRLVNFNFKKQLYIIDPNRIFTRIGLKENMTKLKVYKPEAASVVNKLSNEILKNYVDDKRLVVALHNNTEDKYSILSYKKGMAEALNASKVHINPDMDPDDFILTTDTSIYRKIKEKNINVVLQSTRAKDDGSLSIYTQRKKIPYINIEAQHGHVDEQREMIMALQDIIAGYTDIIELNYINNKK